MRTIKILALYVLAIAVIGSLLAPLMWVALQALRDAGLEAAWLDKVNFRRVAHRTLMIVALVLLWPMLRALRLPHRADWGYAVDWRGGLRAVGIGLAFGLVSMSLLVGSLILIGVREWTPGVGLGTILKVLVQGSIAGLVISLIEETMFRGALFSAWRQGQRVALAIGATAVAYAAVHFIKGDPHIPVVHWYSGFTVLAGSFENFGRAHNIGPFIALVAVGIFLATLRHYVGHVAYGIGIHAGWVAMIRGGIKVSDYVPDHPLAWLAPNSYDNITGPLAALYLLSWTAILILWQRRKRATAGEGK